MKKISVLIIDDSVIIRQVLREILSSDEHIAVVGEAENPIVARELIKQLSPDVLTLDVEMPKMDGITFLANLMRLRPMPVVMLSTLTTKGADITLQALELGAVDFISKPDESILSTLNYFKREVIQKVKQAYEVDAKTYLLNHALLEENYGVIHKFNGKYNSNHLIAIGASTGGNDAIKNILMALPENSPPIVITQHIPKQFSSKFAKRLNKECAMEVQEAYHGQKIKQGNVYIAPGDKHLLVSKKNGSLFCVLDDADPVNRHKPSVDMLFHSLLPIAKNVQAVLLTGMGRDGAQELFNLKQQGARTIIQNKATSLVWGMPGYAYKLNAHCEELPLTDIGLSLLNFASSTNSDEKREI